MKFLLILLSLICLVFLSCSSQKVAGTISDTDTGKSAMVYNPDKSPAIGATVKFFDVGDTTRESASETHTDSSGRYSTTGVGKGTYNILAKKGDLVAFQDSAYISPDTNFIKPETLSTAGSITGIVGLQPNHDPRTSTVQILGTDNYSGVDSSGRFTLSGVAKGAYLLRLVTTLPDYTATFKSVKIDSVGADTLADTLFLTYTGIPVVTGLSATYDTVNGVVRLSWKGTAYRNFQNYLVFRDFYDSINLSTSPIAATGDTTFLDTIFARSKTSGQFSFADTNDYHFKYRVCIEDNSTNRGTTYKYVGIATPSPTKAQTTVILESFCKPKGFKADTAATNDTVLYTAIASNPTRNLTSLVWTDIDGARRIRTVQLDSAVNRITDTLCLEWTTTGQKALECAVTDVAGMSWRDTLLTTIVRDTPIVRLGVPLLEVATGDTIRLHADAADRFGTIAKYEWNFGNTGSWSTSIGTDTFVLAPVQPTFDYCCAVRVTNVVGGSRMDSVQIRVDATHILTEAAEFGPRYNFSTVIFDNKVWVVGGGLEPPQDAYRNDTWFSEDGTTWQLGTAAAAFPPRAQALFLAYNGKLWVIGGQSADQVSLLNDVWYSSDGSEWFQACSSAAFPLREFASSVVFDNKMWVIGGYQKDGGLLKNGCSLNDVWYSQDGINWKLADSSAQFPPRLGHASLAFAGKIWVIGGSGDHGVLNDAWSSIDGITWTQAISPIPSDSLIVLDCAASENQMLLIGTDGSNTRHVWTSADASNWLQLPASASFSQRNGARVHAAVLKDRFLIVGDGFENSVWYIDQY